MKEVNYDELRENLIKIYESYINGKLTEDIRELAGKVYSKYLYASPLLTRELLEAIGPLDGIAWPGIIENSGRQPLSKEKAKIILENLQKRK